MELPDEIRDDLESRENVVGTCLGPKRVDGQPTDEQVLIVLVSRKLPAAQVAAADRIPPEVDVDGETMKTDVQEVGDVRMQASATEQPDRTRRYRPAPGGVSLGHPETSAGTLGSPPLETDDGETVVLTNAHVAAPIGASAPGDPIRQPGPADGGTTEDDIGTLLDASDVARDEPNTTDSALVAVDPSAVEDRLLGIGGFAGFTEPTMDATYEKSGRTTGVTTGEQIGRASCRERV